MRVELTTALRTSLQRHTFPRLRNGSIPRLNVDVTNAAGGSATTPLLGINATAGRVTAAAEFSASFGPGRYAVYGCVDFARESGGQAEQIVPEEWGVWQSNVPLIDLTDAQQIYLGFGSEVGALLGFAPTSNSTGSTLLVRTGVSFISTDQACANAEADIPDFDFDGKAEAARASWNDLLGRVQVTLGDGDDQKDMRELLYSSVSSAMCTFEMVLMRLGSSIGHTSSRRTVRASRRFQFLESVAE